MAFLKSRIEPRRAARRVVELVEGAVGERLLSAVLYGSVVTGEFDEAESDVNVALVLSALGPPELESLRAIHPAWSNARVERPLLLSREAMSHSLDTYPLEYLLIREQHELLQGADLFAGLAIERAALRQEVERVLRAQQLGLAVTYVALAGTPAGARHWAARAATALTASASGLLHLLGEEIPRGRAAVAGRCAARFGFDESAVRHLVGRGAERGPDRPSQEVLAAAQQVLKRLIAEVERLDAGPS